MTPSDLYPVVLFLAVLAMAILWRLRGLVTARVSARRLATAAIGVLATLLVISLLVRFIAPGLQIPSSRLLSWQLMGGSLNSTNAVRIEVEHPFCVPTDAGAWLADPIISYTPWSVTITMHMNDTADTAKCSSQQASHQGLPLVGGYLTGIFYTVQLTEPLGGRALLDGSSFPPAERSLR